jgi:hypothetical protein
MDVMWFPSKSQILRTTVVGLFEVTVLGSRDGELALRLWNVDSAAEFLTLDMRVAFRFGHAVNIPKPTLFWSDDLAANRAGNGLRLPKEHGTPLTQSISHNSLFKPTHYPHNS